LLTFFSDIFDFLVRLNLLKWKFVCWFAGQHVFGPVSVKAIREGDVFLPYGAAAFFASLNSDIRHWVHQDDLNWIQKTKKHGLV
jgi:hypothetical protein